MVTPSSSSSSFFGFRDHEDRLNQLKQQPLPPPPPPPVTISSSSDIAIPTASPPKKKRNLPGNPNPDAEVIALSPKTLMATNRFVCEVCSKGFQREQNLQLHRRGHNLPWKLKQRNNKEAVRRRVYLCPEPSCVHHDPSRALGDLTGIKKHFFRKHGEKKWKCDKCSKRYAVQSDWKAHSKTCGTREYRCDCGTLFSRRDSFITHRAFCDALAQETIRQLPAGITNGHLYPANTTNILAQLGLSQPFSDHLSSSFHPHPDLLPLAAGGSAASYSPPPAAFYTGRDASDKHFHENAPNYSNHFAAHPSFFSNNAGLMSDQLPDQLFHTAVRGDAILPQTSATALLQKAAQIGSTSSNADGGGGASLYRGFRSSHNIYSMENGNHLHDIINSFAMNGGGTAVCGGGGGGQLDDDADRLREFINGGGLRSMEESGGYQQNHGLTRDFLGVGMAFDPEIKPGGAPNMPFLSNRRS